MKKYLLFIVEGENDKREIQAIVRAAWGDYFKANFVDAYHVHKGDITTERDTSEKTIIGKLNNIIISWRNGGEQPFLKILPTDVEKIIHVVDSDGVFIPESSIILTEDAKVQYQECSIEYFDREAIIGRNRKKAKVIRKLLEVKRIDNIPYELYFASCNMDHLLFNQRNPIQKEKNNFAFAFASRCKERAYLLTSVLSHEIGFNGTLNDSWTMIQEGHNSLQRHTNINILLNDVAADCTKEATE